MLLELRGEDIEEIVCAFKSSFAECLNYEKCSGETRRAIEESILMLLRKHQ